MLIEALSIFILVTAGDSSHERARRFNTVCADALKDLLGQKPEGRAGLILSWIRANATMNSHIRLWYFDRKEKRWRRHLFSSLALSRIVRVPDADPEIILRDQGEAYRLKDFYFRNEIKLSEAEEQAHIKDVSDAIRRSYQYPQEARVSPFGPTGTEIMLHNFMALDPLLVQELIASNPERATRVIHEMIREIRKRFSDRASGTIARDFGIRGTEEQIGVEARARKKLEEIYAATGDERLNPSKIFEGPNQSHMTMAGADALSQVREWVAPIYRYRGATGDHRLPRNPETLESIIRARLTRMGENGRSKADFEWALLRDERTFDELKKLSQRDRGIYDSLIRWIVEEIKTVVIDQDALPSQEFVARLNDLSEKLNEPRLNASSVFVSLIGAERFANLPREQGSEPADKIVARFKRRLLRIGLDHDISTESYRREILDPRTEVQLRAIRASLDRDAYQEAIDFLNRHIRDRDLMNEELRAHLHWLAGRLDEPRLKPQ